MNWQEGQIQALVAAGVDTVDAVANVHFVAALVDQAGLDAVSYLPTALDLQERIEDSVQDARIAWYSNAPVWAKRLLDAGGE